MRIFTRLYDYIIELAKKKNVTKYLYFISFIESFIFPIPPDVLLAPIALTKKYNSLASRYIIDRFIHFQF